MVDTKEEETPVSAVQNIAFAFGMMLAAGLGSQVQHECLRDSLVTLAKAAGVDPLVTETALYKWRGL